MTFVREDYALYGVLGSFWDWVSSSYDNTVLERKTAWKGIPARAVNRSRVATSGLGLWVNRVKLKFAHHPSVHRLAFNTLSRNTLASNKNLTESELSPVVLAGLKQHPLEGRIS